MLRNYVVLQQTMGKMLAHKCLYFFKIFSERNKSAHLNIKAKKKKRTDEMQNARNVCQGVGRFDVA
jgi:hypothetical protein